MPPPPAHFVGRDVFLGDLIDRLLSADNRFVSIEGLPSVGKTTLAIAVAHAPIVRQHFKHGVLWAGVGPQPDVTRVLADWAEALECDLSTAATEEQRAQAVKDAIGQRRMLLVIDDVWQLGAAQLLRCGGPDCCHLLTTRDKTIASAFAGKTQTQTVPVLDDNASYELLRAHAPEACQTDPMAARRLALSVGGLPLVLELLGGYLAAPERSYFSELSAAAIAELNDASVRLQLAARRLGTIGTKEVTLQRAIDLSLDGLEEKAVTAFYDLGAFAPKPARFDREAAAAVTAVEPKTLALLIARNLVEGQGDQLTFHQMLADVARTKLSEIAVGRHRDYYLALVNQHQDLPWRIRAAYEQIKWAWQFLPEQPLLLNWVWALDWYQQTRGLWQDFLAWASRGLAIAVCNGLQRDEGALTANIGLAYFALGQPDKALDYYRQALPLLEDAADRAGYATTLNNIGHVYHALGKEGDALACYQQAYAIFREIGDHGRQGSTARKMAEIFTSSGETQQEARYIRLAAEHYKLFFKMSKEAIEAREAGQDPSVSPRGDVRRATTRVRATDDFTGQQEAEQRPDFLRFLDDYVNDRDEYPGFEGIISIVVKRNDDTAFYWRAMFAPGEEVEAEFIEYVPRDANAVLILGEAEADAILETGKIPGDARLAVVEGDRDLFKRFAQRYFISADLHRNGDSLLSQGMYPEAEALSTRALIMGQDGAEVYYFRGAARAGLGNCAGAEADYSAAIDRGLRDAEIYFNLGRVQLELNKYSEAAANLTAAIDNRWDHADVFHARGFARQALNDYSGAEEDYTETLARGGGEDDAQVYYFRGAARESQGNYAGAEADYSAAIDRGIDDSEIYFKLGKVQAEQHNYSHAETNLTTAIDSGRDDADVFHARGFVRQALHDYSGSERDYTEAIARGMGQEGTEIYSYFRGVARAYLGNYAGAEADYSAAIDRGMDNAEIFFNLGRIQLEQNNYSDAAANLTAAIDAGQDDADVFLARGLARHALNDFSGAEADYTEAIARGVNNGEIYFERGRARFQQENNANAEADFTKAIELGNDNAEAYFTRGMAKIFQENYAEAESDLTMAIDRGWEDTEAFLWRGLSRDILGKYLEAEADFTKSIGASGDDKADVYYFRGLARRSLGNHAGAQQDYTEAIARGQDDAEVYQNRAHANIRLGLLEQGQGDCDRAKQRAQDDPVTRAREGDLNLARGEYGLAIACYQSALQAASDGGWYFELGLAFLLAGRFKEAKSAYQDGLHQSSTREIQAASRELEFWTARQTELGESSEAKEAVDTICQMLGVRIGVRHSGHRK